MPKETIVVVDDEAFARNAVTKVLSSNGYTVYALPGGQEAIDFAIKQPFDVLLTDFRMPGGLDGLTTIRAVQRIHPGIVAIIMTANTTLDLAVQSLNLGVHGFVVKPFTSHELLKTIQQTLERQRLIRENTKLNALMSVYATAEALITANTDQQTLPTLAVAFALEETNSNEAYLFLESSDRLKELELISVGLNYSTNDPRSEKYHSSPLFSGNLTGQLTRFTFPDPSFFAAANIDLIIHFHQQAQEIMKGQPQIFEIDQQSLNYGSGEGIPMQVDNCAILVPMKVQGRVIGVMCIRRDKSNQTYSEVDLHTIGLLAGQAAIAIENAGLFTRLARIEALREADRLRREFVSTVSHELRTPLTSIKGYTTTLMRDDVTWNSRVGKEYLGIISEECDKLMELIDNILEVSKIEVGVLRMYLEPVQINQIVERAENEARHRFPELKLNLEIMPDAETPYVMADPRRILQVLRNLLGNAVKYAPDGTPINIKIDTNYYSDLNPEVPMVCISVEDKGIGLKSEDLEQVFERFYRVDNSPARMTEGTGLGLAICRGIIDAHNGHIWAESDGLGRGTKFLFTLPVVILSDNVAAG